MFNDIFFNSLFTSFSLSRNFKLFNQETDVFNFNEDVSGLKIDCGISKSFEN